MGKYRTAVSVVHKNKNIEQQSQWSTKTKIKTCFFCMMRAWHHVRK